MSAAAKFSAAAIRTQALLHKEIFGSVGVEFVIVGTSGEPNHLFGLPRNRWLRTCIPSRITSALSRDTQSAKIFLKQRGKRCVRRKLLNADKFQGLPDELYQAAGVAQ